MGSPILTLEDAGARGAGAAPAAPGAARARRRSRSARRRRPPPRRAPRRRRRLRPISPASTPAGRAPSGARTRRSIYTIARHRRKGPHHQRGREGGARRRRRRRRGGGRRCRKIPAVDFAKFGPIETKPLSRIKSISGPRLHASWVNIPHVTHSDEADVTDLEAFRKSLDDAAKADKKAPYRVSLLPLLMKASVATLKAFPTFNAALRPAKDALIYQASTGNIGVAVDTPEGLVVAVVKDVDKKGVIELARELGALSAKAREGKLSPTEMQGATFTISSLGGIGGARSRRSSMRRKWRSSASCARRWRRCGTARRSFRA